METQAIVMDAAACMPTSCWGRYRRVAVVIVECDEGGTPIQPRMISTHARGVIRIVRTWERLNVGITDRCAFARAKADAQIVADQINATKDNPQ